MTPEFSHIVRAHDIGGHPKMHPLAANEAERAALAKRFDLLTLDTLTADIETRREAAGIRVTGRFSASGDQPCVATAEPVAFLVGGEISLLLTDKPPEGTEIELADSDIDIEIMDGDTVDLGEIVAQALALALDPYPRSALPAPGVISEAEARAVSNPFAALKKL